MKYRFEEIDRWFERTFPTVRQFLQDYPKQEKKAISKKTTIRKTTKKQEEYK